MIINIGRSTVSNGEILESKALPQSTSYISFETVLKTIDHLVFLTLTISNLNIYKNVCLTIHFILIVIQ